MVSRRRDAAARRRGRVPYPSAEALTVLLDVPHPWEHDADALAAFFDLYAHHGAVMEPLGVKERFWLGEVSEAELAVYVEEQRRKLVAILAGPDDFSHYYRAQLDALEAWVVDRDAG